MKDGTWIYPQGSDCQTCYGMILFDDLYIFFINIYFLIFEGNEEKIVNCTFKDTLHSVILV